MFSSSNCAHIYFEEIENENENVVKDVKDSNFKLYVDL